MPIYDMVYVYFYVRKRNACRRLKKRPAAGSRESAMKCTNCGARLRKSDRFCPACGLSRNPEEELNAYPGSRVGPEGRTIKRSGGSRVIREPLYDEHLYKDMLKEERKEERSQALLITLAAVLLIALLGAGFVTFYFMVRQKTGRLPSAGAAGTAGASGTAGVAGTDWSQSVDGQDGGDVITIYPESEAQDGAGSAEGAAAGQAGSAAGAAAGQTGAGSAEGAAAGQSQSETATEAETSTEAATSAAAPEAAAAQANDAGRIDFSEIARIMAEQSEADTYGVCIYDLKQKKAYVTGSGDDPMYASATITVPILYTAAALLDQGTVTMDDPIVYVNSIGGRGQADPHLRDGKEYPLSYYLETMLTFSDNNCINVLIDYFGLDRINQICHEGGFASVDLQRAIVAEVTDGSENYVSAADLGGMVRDLYGGRFSRIDQAFMEQYFRIDASDEGRTVIGLAPGVRDAEVFLNQDGMGETRFAEVAVVSDGNCSYILSQMMTGPYGFAYIDAGIGISEYVYKALAGLQD